MGLAELFILAVGLAMDAFAVSICKGVCLKKASLAQSAAVGAYFGIFQAGMPIIGYFLGTGFADRIERYDHWVAFALLLVLGGKMFIESFKKEDAESTAAGNDRDELKFTKMLVLAIATSIDALAVGITLAFYRRGNLHNFRSGSQDRPCVRREIHEQSGACRRNYSNGDRRKNTP